MRDRLAEAGIRVELDSRVEKINYKIREAELQRVPYMLTVGDREAADGTVAVRTRSSKHLRTLGLDDFVASALDEIRRKDLGVKAPAAEQQPA